jgi:hypothetical protein
MTYRTYTDFVIAPDGDKLWLDNRKCPHSNENACSFCDHDRYYAHKHRSGCPWWDVS